MVLSKSSTFAMSINEKLEVIGRTDKNAMDASSTSPRKARVEYWMKEIATVFSSGLNGRIREEPKTGKNAR